MDDLIREWNALMDSLSYEQRVYLQALGIGMLYLDRRGADARQIAALRARLQAHIERARQAIQWLDPAALVPMPPKPSPPDPYAAPFQPTHVGRRAGSLVQVMHQMDGAGFVEYRGPAGCSGCSAREFRRLFKPLPTAQRTFLHLL
ncbi:MAG: hypothetical protein KKA73_22060 [Chloroflexi bacterium]|nr:hypothetical protein [Chloroflexota bacterium]MBU1750378.1 hypothetical protein [Chloroflexota bacterium]